MSLDIKIDITAVSGLAERLGLLDAQAFGDLAVRTVNVVADETYDLVRPRMVNTVNLTDSYVQSRMEVRHAKSANDATATIIARGSGADMTILARYGAKQLMQPVKYPNASFAAGARGRNPKKPGSALSWKPRIGDASRGIPVDMKGAGISVEVTRGSRKDIAGGFLMHLNNGNGVGLFTRSGDKLTMKHRYGPSVYQLFSVAATKMLDDIGESLESQLVIEAEKLFTKALE